jgi:predicted nuclease of restriction endonuclease-like (RecB) superfamily
MCEGKYAIVNDSSGTKSAMKSSHEKNRAREERTSILMSDMISNGYGALLVEIKERIRKAQYKALREVNRELVKLYWDIGKIIAERQQSYSWGEAVVERLARDLQEEFPGIKGFSSRNVWRMREFFIAYADEPKLPPLVAEIGWTHNTIVLEHCKDNLEREFYVRMTRKYGWTKNVLRLSNPPYESHPASLSSRL